MLLMEALSDWDGNCLGYFANRLNNESVFNVEIIASMIAIEIIVSKD